MRVVAVGCTGSVPGPESPASCYLIEAPWQGRTFGIVLDLGNGSLGTLQRYRDPASLDAVLLTHLHPDHCLDLCSLYVLLRYSGTPRAERLPVYGPPGTAERMARAYGVKEAEPLDAGYQFAVLSDGQPLRLGPFTVTPYRMNHLVETYGLRVEETSPGGGDAGGARGPVVAYTGDTDSCANLLPLMREADLVLTDTAFVDSRPHAPGIHLTGSRAAAAAREAGGVRRLVLTHLTPWHDPAECRADAQRAWPGGPIELCRPGAVFELG